MASLTLANKPPWSRIRLSCKSNPPCDTRKTCRRAPKVLRPLISRSVPGAGDWSTVNVGAVAADEPYEQHSIAGYRQVIDLSSVNDSRFLDALELIKIAAVGGAEMQIGFIALAGTAVLRLSDATLSGLDLKTLVLGGKAATGMTVADMDRAIDFYTRVLGMTAVTFAGGRRGFLSAARRPQFAAELEAIAVALLRVRADRGLEHLAIAAKENGIGVSLLCPQAVDTPMLGGAAGSQHGAAGQTGGVMGLGRLRHGHPLG